MKILIGSCGGLTGIYLARQYKKDNYLVGIDNNYKSTGKFFVDDFVIVPSFREKDYIDRVTEILLKYKIDVFIPTHSEEISIVSENKDKIEKIIKGKLLVCDIQTIRIFENKLNAYIEVNKKGIRCPRIIYNDADIKQFPVLLKPKIGSGSCGIIKINTIDEYNLYASNTSLFFTDYYDWDEYTVDCFFSRNFGLVDYYIRKRIKSIGGAVSITESAMEIDISREIRILENEFAFIGPVNFQFFYQGGEKIFFDFNLRFASGGLPLAVHSGLNIPNLLLQESMGIIYDKNININLSKMPMYRYYEELFD
ncbi:hypothetical protein AGMMS49944_18650 [Spirochaetia bacterium]|nr:hypothetical protein AGMMS49944_18650 [Spirochaetia bacterium]